MPANYTDAVKCLRRRLRPYSVFAIIDACIEVLDSGRGTGLDELKSAPWLTLLIVKLVLEDELIVLCGTRQCPTALIEEIRNDLWNTSVTHKREGSPSIYLMIRSLVHTQLLFQQTESFAFLRWPALISRLPPEHLLRGQFEAEFSCDPETVPDAGFMGLSEDQMKTMPDDFLADELRQRVARSPMSFTMQFQLAEAGDPTNDPTVTWPDSRTLVSVGKLVIDKVEAGMGGACENMTFNPLVLPTGLQASDDPVLLARAAPYAVSLGRRLTETRP